MKLVLLAALLATSTFGCAAARSSAPPPAPPPVAPRPPSGAALQRFEEALATFVKHDEARDWDRASCAAVAGMFEGAAAAQRAPFVQATYDAGLAFERCKDDANALLRFQKASKDDPSFDPVLARLALYRFKESADVDAAILSLQRAIELGQFKNAGALVDLASMQMARDGKQSAPGCEDDMDCAKRNLQRALAIDDTYVPASNQLALYYLQLARKRAGVIPAQHRGAAAGRGRRMVSSVASSKRPDVQQLELAALVCSQAIAKNARYATLHNTAGLVLNELGQINGAVAAFATATKLDPAFFEAQMNYAAANLSFRGFDQAQGAYRKALAIRPNDYDAHLGLALAMRGPLSGSEADYEQRLAAVAHELDAARTSDPERPDAYFNEGILMHELQARAGSTKDQTLLALGRAKASFERFLEKARGKSEYEGAVAKAKERLQDIDTSRAFLEAPAPQLATPPVTKP